MAKLSPAHEIIVHPIAGQAIHQRTRDGYIDVGGMCEVSGRDFHDYERQSGTASFLAELSRQTGLPVRPKPGFPGFALIQSVRGGPHPELRGIWAHRRVAVHLGQWLSVEFQVWVTGIVEDYDRMRRLLSERPADWSKQYPDLFWQEIYRLKGWPWHGMGMNRNQECGRIVTDLVYDRLVAPGLSESIELDIPRRANGGHAVKMHQMLVATVGLDALQRHIEILLTIMDRQATWPEFMIAVDIVLPKVRQRLPPSSPEQGELDL